MGRWVIASFTVNGKPILIRGAGYTPDFLYRRDASRDEAEMRYVRAMNLGPSTTLGPTTQVAASLPASTTS